MRTRTTTTTTTTTNTVTESERRPHRPAPAAAAPGYPTELERDWQAADDLVVRIRPLRPIYLESELKFYPGGSSEQTLYLALQNSIA